MSRIRSRRMTDRRGRGGLSVLVATAVILAAGAADAAAPARRAGPPAQDLAPVVNGIAAELKAAREDLAALRLDLTALSGRVDEAAATAESVKKIAEPMREEVRGLYVETSNVRSEIARLEQTWAENTEALARSRYVLTLLLVATAALQLVVLAVLLRSR